MTEDFRRRRPTAMRPDLPAANAAAADGSMRANAAAADGSMRADVPTIGKARGTNQEGGARRWWALIAIAASVLVVGLDLTVLTLALPTIARDLHASTSDLQWIQDAYSLVLAAAILPAGMLGDRLGRKKLLLIALALFGASSAAGAYAAGTGELIAARALLGIGASAILPLSLSVIPVMFREEERQKAITLMASATFLSFPIGPIVGGYLLNHFWWGSVFLINVPVVVIALVAVAFLLPESRSEQRLRVDTAGVVISAIGLVGLTYGFIRVGQYSWTDPQALMSIAAGVVVLAGFVWWERLLTGRGVRALVELPLFSSAGFRWGTILTTLVSFAMFGLMFAMPQYFQEVGGADPLGAGVRGLPLLGGMMIGMIGGTRLLAPRKASARPPLLSAKSVVAGGFAIMGVGLGIGALTSITTGTGYALSWMAVAGLGLGLALPAAMTAALAALSAERSGSGSALISAVRQVGATIGVAVLGTVLSNGYTSKLHLAGLPDAAAGTAKSSVAGGVEVARRLGSAGFLDEVRVAFVHGLDVMLWCCMGIAIASAVLALAFLPRRAGQATGQARMEI